MSSVNSIPISANPSVAIQGVADLVHALQVSRFLIIAGYIVLLYDHVLTFSEEIKFIWMRPKNLISSIFLVNRYLVPLVLALDLYIQLGLAPALTVGLTAAVIRSCRNWATIEVVFHLSSHASVHAIVAIRVNALWGDQPRIKWSLFTLWLAYCIVGLTISLAAVLEGLDTLAPNPITNSCVGVLPRFVWSVWVGPLLLEGVLFGLTVVKAAQQRTRSITSMPVAYILYRDGIIYFFVISFCSIFNVIVWGALPYQWFLLAKMFTFGMVTAMGSRMVLNLRSLGGVREGSGRATEFETRPVPLRDLSVSRLRRHQPYGDLEASATDVLATKKDTPDRYVYERQANQLRQMQIERPEFGKRGTFKIGHNKNLPVASLTGVTVSQTSYREESIAKDALSYKSSGTRRSSWESGVSPIEENENELYYAESYPLPPVSTVERTVVLEESKSSETSLTSPY